MTKVKCNCVICDTYIGKFYPYEIRKTCSIKCRKILNQLNMRGENNPNYNPNKIRKKFCKVCNIEIDRRAMFCSKHKFNFYKVPFKGKKHTEKAKKVIGKKSSEKFTKEFIKKVYHDRRVGTKKKTINGYITIKDYNHPMRTSQNDVLEHRLIIEKNIKRYLDKKEVVHHIDFNRSNNNIENLYLYKNTSEHTSKAHKSIFDLIPKLLKRKIIRFEEGIYIINEVI